MHGRWRRVWVSAAIFALLGAVTPAGIAEVTTEEAPRKAAVVWDDSIAPGGNLRTCDAHNDAVCLDQVWITMSDGQRIYGQVIPSKLGASGQLVSFLADDGNVVRTLWLTFTSPFPDGPVGASPIPSNSFFLMQGLIRSVEAGITNDPTRCTDGDASGVLWCVADTPIDFRIGVTIRSGYQFYGWINGRLGEPTASIDPPTPGKPGVLSLEASPFRLPTMSVEFSHDDEEDRAAWTRMVAMTRQTWGDGAGLPLQDWSEFQGDFRQVASPILPLTFDQLAKAAAPRLSRATGWATVWQVDVTFHNRDDASASCWIGDGSLLSLTSSNALTYKRELVWDDFTRELVFTMASPSLDVDGNRMKGDFFAFISRKGMECFWGALTPQDQVRLQVIDENGTEVVANASVTSSEDGIYLRAFGFGFSLKKAEISQVRKGAPPDPQGVTASARGANVTVTWKAQKGVSYRVRLTPARFGSPAMFASVAKGRKAVALFKRVAAGAYLVEVVAIKGQLQSRSIGASVEVK